MGKSVLIGRGNVAGIGGRNTADFFAGPEVAVKMILSPRIR